MPRPHHIPPEMQTCAHGGSRRDKVPWNMRLRKQARRPLMALLRPGGVSGRCPMLEVNRTIAGPPRFVMSKVRKQRDLAIPEAAEVGFRLSATSATSYSCFLLTHAHTQSRPPGSFGSAFVCASQSRRTRAAPFLGFTRSHQERLAANTRHEHDHAHRVQDVSRGSVQHAPLDRSPDCRSAASGATPSPPAPPPATAPGTSTRRVSGSRARRHPRRRTPRRIAR